ncbi:uncharacterized protein METZ01_LOCUS170575, partial [marine metagenome]
MSEEILEQESEEEEIVEEDSSDKKIKAEAKSKASVKKEDGEEAEDDVEESQDFERDSDADMDDATGGEKEVDPEKVKLKAVPAGEAAIPKTKNGMLSAVYEKLNSLKKDELKSKYESILKATSIIVEEDEEEAEPEEDVKRTKAAIKTEDIHIDVKDDVEALVQGEDGLTEDFKKKASTIFEAAVQAKVVEEVNNKLKELDGETAKEGE